MKNALIALGVLSCCVAGQATRAAAQDSMRTTTTRTETVPVVRENQTVTETTTQRRGIDGTRVVESTETKTQRAPGLSTQTNTTVTTDETWTGMVRRVEPTRTTFIVNGQEYVLSGPVAPEMVNKEVRIIGRMNAPTKTIQVTRYEQIQ